MNEDNVHARLAAKEFHELAEESEWTDSEAFWKKLVELCNTHLPADTDSVPAAMSDEEAVRFESRIMKFGEFQGQAIKQVPLDRLAWYSDVSRQFANELDRYFKNTKVQREYSETAE